MAGARRLADRENDLAHAGRLFFDAPMSFLHVPADTLNEVCRFSDPFAYRLAIVDLQRTLDQRSETTSFSEKVRQLLQKDPGQRSNHWFAHELSISTSTLKRRLSEEGTTFRELRRIISCASARCCSYSTAQCR